MADIRIDSWSELTEALYDQSWKESIERFRSSYAYRGMQNAAHDLRTGLVRLGEGNEQLEAHLLRAFRKYAHRDAAQGDSLWNWLAVAQHHGLPTRLLDWSYSPYVAMHFATEDHEKFDRDGVIWCVDYSATNELLPTKLRTILERESVDVFTAEMLATAASTLMEFDELGEEEFLLFLEPPSLDDRIINQFALFSVASSARLMLDEWLAQHPQTYRRIVIPASVKWEVRDKLDQANVTERVLFPGLDGLSSWLKRYYTPRRSNR